MVETIVIISREALKAADECDTLARIEQRNYRSPQEGPIIVVIVIITIIIIAAIEARGGSSCHCCTIQPRNPESQKRLRADLLSALEFLTG